MIAIKNCYSIQQAWDTKPLKGATLLIENGKITAVGEAIVTPRNAQVIDGSKHIVIPGLVNTHHHFYQTLTRNLPAVQNAELFQWLLYLYNIWKHIGADSIYYSSLLAIGELLKTGCTLTTDHHYLYPSSVEEDIMEIQFQAAGELGIRFAPTRGSMSLSQKDGGLPPDTVVQTGDKILYDSERVIKKYHDSQQGSMQKIALAPCSPFSVTKELMRETAELARSHNVRLHTHLAETEDETAFCLKTYGKRPWDLMKECHFTGNDVWYAHGIHFNDSEIEQLAETGTQVAHCPTSNMRLGSGICRVREMIDRGVNVALAVDGSASNDSSDMLGELRNALLLQRVTKGAAALTAKEALKLGTENGAKLLNFPMVGRLETGWAADIAMFNLDKLEYAGAQSDPLAALIFSGYNHEVDYTIVNGKVVVEKGQLKGIDEETVKRRANEAALKIYQKGGICD